MKRKAKIILLSLLLAIIFSSSVSAAGRKIIEFGSYPQSEVKDQSILNMLEGKSGTVSYEGEKYIAKDGKWYIFEPIRWIVLSETNGKAFVISEKIIDVCALNKEWTDSDAREWLNTTFINSAFDVSEKKCIYTTTVNSVGEQVTQDKIFYPSQEELTNAQYGFSSNEDRVVSDTAYSSASQTYLTRDTRAFFGIKFVVAVYGWSGNIVGTMPIYARYGARPCMNISLSDVQRIEKEKVKDFSKATITLSKTSYKYDGKAKTPSVTVEYNGEKLGLSDYSVKYSDNKYAGTATAEITGKGSYNGTVKKIFTITAGKKIAITFKGNGGTVSKKSINVNMGSKYGTLPTGKYKGYRFLGWFTAKNGGEQITKTSYVEITKKQILYAHWKKETYAITYILNGGANPKNNPKSYTVSTKTFSFKNPTRKGYIFKGWYTDSRYKKVIKNISKGTTGNKTLYAKWIPITYSIEFDGNGVITGKMASMNSLKYGVSYNLKKNTYKAPGGKEFRGWNTKKNGSGKNYKNQEAIADLTTKNGAKIKLYAQWQLKRYNIKYVLNGGTNNSKNVTDFNTSEKKEIRNGYREGYTFAGWYKNSNLTGKAVTNVSQLPAKAVTLFAKWKPISYTIKFDGNGRVENVPSSMTCKYGKKYSLPEVNNKDILYWSTSKDGNGRYFNTNETISNLTIKNGDVIILYAIVNKVPEIYAYSSGVSVGNIRRVSQKSDLKNNGWIYDKNGMKYDFTSVAGMECGAASSSTAVSYLGIDVSPGEICYRSGGGSLNFNTVWISWNGLTPKISTGGEFDNYYAAYMNDRNYKISPIIIHIPAYPGASSVYGHWVVVVGKDQDGTYKICDPVDSNMIWNATIKNGTIVGLNGKVNCSIDRIVQYTLG